MPKPIKILNSTLKCNFTSRQEGWAYVESAPFNPVRKRGTNEKLQPAHPNRTLSDLRIEESHKNPTEISRVLGRHKSTIYRELKRNLGKRGYRAVQAHQFAFERHRSRDRRRISWEDWQLIESLIRRDWSPEQISLWLKEYKKSRSVMSGSISIFWRISPKQEISTLTCAQGKNAKNVTAVRTAEEWF